MVEKIVDAFTRPVYLSVANIIIITGILFSCYLFVDNTFASKDEVSVFKQTIIQDIRDIKADVQYLVRLNIKDKK